MFPRFVSAGFVAGLILAVLAPAPVRALEPTNLGYAKREMRQYIDSGEYFKSVAEVALQANKYLLRRVGHPPPKSKRFAIVLDIDETALTNLSTIVGNDFGFSQKTWDEWIRLGQCPAIIPIQTVYDTAIRNKVDVFFITGRGEADRVATERNLRQVGYETWKEIYFKPTDDPNLTTARFKTGIRRQLVSQGYDIIENIGDQISDVVNGYADRYFLLPNPFYKIY